MMVGKTGRFEKSLLKQNAVPQNPALFLSWGSELNVECSYLTTASEISKPPNHAPIKSNIINPTGFSQTQIECLIKKMNFLC